jgi:hypothetical protein
MDMQEPGALNPMLGGNMGNTAASNSHFIPEEDVRLGILSYERVLSSVPDLYQAREGLAMLHMMRGEEDLALQHFGLVAQQCDTCTTAWYQFAMLGKKPANLWRAAQKLQDLLDDTSSPATPNDRNVYLRQLTALYDRMGLHEEAFNTNGELIALAPANVLGSSQDFIDSLKHTMACETRTAHFKLASKPMANRVLPFFQSDKGIKREMVFIVGLPRTGSTMVQQILSRGSNVFTVEKSGVVSSVMSKAREYSKGQGYSCYLDMLTSQGAFDELTDVILGYYAEVVSPEKTLVVDKDLTNFQNLGLIKLMFPDAKFILCTRNIKDTGALYI